MTKKSNTVTTKDMNYGSVGFNTLNLDELQSIADYYGVDKAETIQEQIANFASEGVTYAQYAKDMKVPLPEDYEEELPEVDEDEINLEAETVQQVPVTVPRQVALPDTTYLIKMTRDNPYFEVAAKDGSRKVYKFTQQHPYAVMDRHTAQYVLAHEERFRQAFPDELAEFYES